MVIFEIKKNKKYILLRKYLIKSKTQ